MPWIVIIVWLIVPLFVGIAFYANHKREQQRREEFQSLAGGLGLESFEHLPADDAERFDRFALASRGRNGQISNVIVADSGELRMVIFDFKFTTGSGKNKTTHRQTVVQIHNEALSLPAFTIGPESFMHRLGNFLGIDDIDFAEDEEFSNRFLLNGDDEQAVRAFFDADRRRALMKHASVSVEARGSDFIFFQRQKRWEVSEIKSLMSDAFEINGVLNA